MGLDEKRSHVNMSFQNDYFIESTVHLRTIAQNRLGPWRLPAQDDVLDGFPLLLRHDGEATPGVDDIRRVLPLHHHVDARRLRAAVVGLGKVVVLRSPQPIGGGFVRGEGVGVPLSNLLHGEAVVFRHFCFTFFCKCPLFNINLLIPLFIQPVTLELCRFSY